MGSEYFKDFTGLDLQIMMPFDFGMARLYIASCYSAMEDILFDNSKEEDEISCQCAKCEKRRELQALHHQRCLYSDCNPEEHQSLPPRRSNPAPRI
jgi:hypothetical protein